jgi:hypothetical protein
MRKLVSHHYALYTHSSWERRHGVQFCRGRKVRACERRGDDTLADTPYMQMLRSFLSLAMLRKQARGTAAK